MEDDGYLRSAVKRLLNACTSDPGQVVLPALNAKSASLLLCHLCADIGGRHLDDAHAQAVCMAVKCVLKAINGTVSNCSIEIKVDLSRCCLSLLNSSVLVLSPSVTSIVHCFALMPVHFDQVHSVFEAGTHSHERAAIGEMLRLGLREALSSFPAPPQANVLAFTIMLCLLRQIESSLLMSAFCTLLRFGNDAACRSLARVQEHDVLRMFFAAAKEEEEHGDAAVLSPAIRVAQALRKQLGVSSLHRELFDKAVDGDSSVAQTRQQKEAVFAAQQANVSRLLRAHRIETASLYACRSAQHAQQLQLHLIRVLCSMNMKSEAVRHTEVWGLQNDSEIQRVLRECSSSVTTGLASQIESYLRLPENVKVVTVYDASDIQQAEVAAEILGINGDEFAPAVAIDVEWPCAAWDGNGCASIMQVASIFGCIVFDLHAICSNSSSTVAFSNLITRLFLSSSCTKLFYGCDQDMRILRSSWPGVQGFRVGLCNCLELNQMAAAVRVDLRNKSLSDVCSAFLGLPLNKKQRLSNWALRPLTSEQISYAALDVYAPILIFEHLRKTFNDPVAEFALELGHERFESLCFDVTDAAIAGGFGFIVSQVPRISKTPNDACETAVSIKDFAVSVRLEANQSTAARHMPRTLPSEIAICHGAHEVTAALESSGVGPAFEIISFPDDDAGQSQVATSKFEVFDRIQLHACAVGMMRHQLQHVLKTLCVLVKPAGAIERRYAVVMIGDTFLDMAKVAVAVGCSRRHVQLAPAADVLRLFGYVIGAVPPVGFWPGTGGSVRVLIDKNVRSLGLDCCVLVGSGYTSAVLKLSVDNLIRVITYENAKSGLDNLDPVHDLCRSPEALGSAAQQLKQFESSIDSDPSPILRLACDSSIARAGKWLRAMGVDCILVDTPTVEIIEVMHAEARVFLSADRKLVEKKEFQNSPVLLVLGTDAKEQLLEIVRHFKIVYNSDRFLVRCVFCNTEAFEELSPEAARVADSHGSMVFTQVPSFQMCSGCKRLFWRGPKFKNTEDHLLDILKLQDPTEN